MRPLERDRNGRLAHLSDSCICAIHYSYSRSCCSGQSRCRRACSERQTVCVPNRITGNERSGAKRSDAALHGTGSS